MRLGGGLGVAQDARDVPRVSPVRMVELAGPAGRRPPPECRIEPPAAQQRARRQAPPGPARAEAAPSVTTRVIARSLGSSLQAIREQPQGRPRQLPSPPTPPSLREPRRLAPAPLHRLALRAQPQGQRRPPPGRPRQPPLLPMPPSLHEPGPLHPGPLHEPGPLHPAPLHEPGPLGTAAILRPCRVLRDGGARRRGAHVPRGPARKVDPKCTELAPPRCLVETAGPTPQALVSLVPTHGA
mmetsp:Transcript_2335/g.6886  ORF Transcript_2335/g.6886 Transcript_2335/m.6886 type:complete len:240 (+) Transcript_2335:359-1078(+)